MMRWFANAVGIPVTCCLVFGCASTTGVERAPDTGVSRADYAGTYRVNGENWIAFASWGRIGLPIHERDSVDSFRFEWRGEDFEVTGMRGSRVVGRGLHRGGRDFTWRSGMLDYARGKASENPYFPGAFGRVSGDDTVFLDQDRNLVIRHTTKESGLLFGVVPSSMSESHFTKFERVGGGR